MYADDTNVFLKNKCYEKLYKIANQELINIDNWLLANRLILNKDKTHYMIFHTAKTKPPKNKVFIPKNYLSWKPHILKKLFIIYGTIKKISKYFDKNILLQLYNSLIISHIRYGIGTWYNDNKSQFKKFNEL